MRPLVLASASPARLRLLRDAGLDPVVVVSGVDEDVESDGPEDLVERLAVAKAQAVASRPEAAGAVVVGCDSMLVLDGAVLGKPGTPEVALERWRRMRGRTGTLLTGHCVVLDDQCVSDVRRTEVRFGTPDDDELAAYVASGEPLHVAGAFTLDGRSAPFVESIDGDPSNVVGLSLPLLRELLARVGVRLVDLWR